jgi:hypothetical protein
MRPVLRTSLLLGTLMAAIAAPAAAGAATVPTTVSPEATMPILFPGTVLIFGHRIDQGAPVPPGATALKIGFPQGAGTFETFSVTCPAGSGAADGAPGEGTPGPGIGLGSPYGERTTQFRFDGPAAAGSIDFYVLCLPVARGTTKRLAARRAPLAFPSPTPGFVKPLPKGRALRADQVLLKTTLTGLKRGQAALATVTCPGRLVPSYGAIASKGFGGVYEGDTFNIQVAPRSGSATLYTICQAPAVF